MLLLEPSVEINLRWLGRLLPGTAEPLIVDLSEQSRRLAVATPGAQNFGAVIDEWRRSCGISRPSSAGRAAVTAATLCRALLKAGHWNPERLGVVTASTTSATATAVRFEERGLTESWGAVDPLLLPSTLLSALATQVAASVGARRSAQAFVVGLLGVFHALEAGVHALVNGQSDAVLLVYSDELTPVQVSTHEMLGWLPLPGEGASALVLERNTGCGMRLAFLAYDASEECEPASGWHGSPRSTYLSRFPSPSMEGAGLFDTLCQALAGGNPRVVVAGGVTGLGSACIGLESVAGSASLPLVQSAASGARP